MTSRKLVSDEVYNPHTVQIMLDLVVGTRITIPLKFDVTAGKLSPRRTAQTPCFSMERETPFRQEEINFQYFQ